MQGLSKCLQPSEVRKNVFISVFVVLEKKYSGNNKPSTSMTVTLTLTHSPEPKRRTAATLLLRHGNSENPESVRGQSVKIGTQNLADVSAAS